MRVCTRAGELLAALEAAGTPLGTEDVMIAATALALDLTVVTRNVRHFGRVARLRVENWWEVAG
jgi:tRNA(fMet)-specific endonuclease VapC